MATGKAPTKSEVLAEVAELSGLDRKQVKSVFESLTQTIQKHMGKKGAGVFVIPGLVKIVQVHKKATKARTGINPFTKEEQLFKAKPARNVIKVRPLKTLKDMA
jgi:nucleoid DNA-binding protein